VNERKLHVIFGAGQIGTPLAKLLRERGQSVRIVRRAGAGPEGVEVRHGDAGDPAFATEAARGAAVVYHCMNPVYDARVWARELPRLLDSLIHAAGRAGAKLVVLDNVYMLGRPREKPLSEDSPIAPASKKGEIRAKMNDRLFEAHRRGDVRATCGRASDFYGPGGNATYFGDALWPNALRKGLAQMPMNPDTPHTYHYTLDVAAGLATLGDAADDVTGRWWMLPCAPADTSRAMVDRFGRVLGRPLEVKRLPKAMMAIAALFTPILREILEMAYQWDEAFVIDDLRFRERFNPVVTPLDEGARATVEWATRKYGGSS
jgi:nucleoside-diphosphate-sugar epimerase